MYAYPYPSLFPQPPQAAAYGEQASQVLTGGVSSSFRYNPFTGWPLYLSHADGARVTDLDGNEYIDFFMGHGACTLGYNRPELRQALLAAIERGFYAGYDHPISAELAAKIVQHIPCAEQVRYVNSGSEGTLLAMRLARGYTGRDKIVRIDGHFHGGHDYVLPNNLVSKIDRQNPGDRLSQITALPAGTPSAIRETILLVPWLHAEVLEDVIRSQAGGIAAILLNPVDYNNGCITPTREYLQAVRALCDRYDILFIMDEILSGFRTGLSCAQGYYGVTPDLTLLGKALTNGVPLGAIAGKAEIMQKIMDPVDPVVAGGTYSGNQLGCAAGVAALSLMEQPGFFPSWLERAERFFQALQSVLDSAGLPAVVQNLGISFYIYVGTREPLHSYADFSRLNPDLARRFFCKCIENGVYFHTDFTLSASHDEATLALALEKIETIARQVA